LRAYGRNIINISDISSICSCAKVPKSSWPETPLPECRWPIIYTKERARQERGLGISLKGAPAPAENSIVKKHVHDGKCRNTDRGPNKNVNSPFHSLLKERCVFFCLRGLAPETCIFIQLARKKVRTGRPGEKAAQPARYTKSPGKILALSQLLCYSYGNIFICRRYVLHMPPNCLRVICLNFNGA